MDRVLVTGAAGTIGGYLRQTLRGVYPALRLSDMAPLDPAGAGEEVDRTDLADMQAVETMLDGVDGVVHLGGISVEDSFDSILPANIVGTYNLFEGARRQGVRRVVFASTNHVVGFYPRDRRLDHQTIPRPDSRYGVSKAYGEALASLYADKYGLEVLCIRIGNVTERPVDKRRLSIWVSPRDFTQLVRIGLETPDLHYKIVYGVSNNERSWWDNSVAEAMGYRPQDNSEDFAEAVLVEEAKRAVDPIAERFQGGTFASDEYAAEET